MCFRSHPFLWSTVHCPAWPDNKVLNGESRGNTGNVLAALQMIANHDDICIGQERLSSLALMPIHYQVKIDLDEVVKLFATKHPRRLELETIMKDKSRSILMYPFTS